MSLFIRNALVTLRTKCNAVNIIFKRKYDTNPHPEEHVADWGDQWFFDASNHRLFAAKYMLFFAIPFWLPFIVVRYHIYRPGMGSGESKGDMAPAKGGKGKK